jgi:hypothetical protein
MNITQNQLSSNMAIMQIIDQSWFKYRILGLGLYSEGPILRKLSICVGTMDACNLCTVTADAVTIEIMIHIGLFKLQT